MDQFTLEIIRNSLFYASEEMGMALRNSAYSPNIKERMDHSAAIFDENGYLIAQAEHIPVHLGSLPWGLKNSIEYLEREGMNMEEGSMFLVNNPYISGTHLNDITVFRPIFYSNKLIAFAANKAHHSDIGGKVPGSISVDAKSIFEEGIIINPVILLKNNEFINDVISFISANSRNPYERKGDLRAQVAANLTGEKRVIELIKKYGLETFRESNSFAFSYAENLSKKRIGTMKKGNYKAIDYLEHPNGKNIKLQVRLEILEKRINVDYEGTDRQVDMPLNAVFGVTISGVYYAFRTLMGEDIPLNQGALNVFNIKAPNGIILNPIFPAPVAGGNVETSQRNVDLIYLAMSKILPEKVPAAAGGSMNNVMIGGILNGKSWAFYETIGVGLGAKKGKDGVDGIQSNMTNTMNTPIEEIERNFPIIIKKYEFRRDSSGAGEFRGGSGIIREYEIQCNNVIFTFLSDRGKIKPWGLFGGLSGENTKVIAKKDGKIKYENVKFSINLNEGDIVKIMTAGGGGYGSPKKRLKERIIKDLENGIISKKYKDKFY
ncbi:MAG: hydantoinase B/oxoprolinase family protein [Thermoplasmata archaeon]